MIVAALQDIVFGCMLHQPTDADGYGRIGRRLAHLVAYELAHGPVPEGLEIEHTCRRRNCVNVAHLETVTRSENELRKSWRYRARIKQCKNGHELSLHAMVTPEGGRVCRECTRAGRRS